MSNTTTTTTIKLTREHKTMSYHAYRATADAILSVVNYRADANEKTERAAGMLSGLIESLHKDKVDGMTLFMNLLTRHVAYKTRKADGAKWVKFNGIASFNKWVKEYKPEGELTVESKAGNDPSVKKEKANTMPTNKEVAFNILRNLPEEERMKLVEALLAA